MENGIKKIEELETRLSALKKFLKIVEKNLKMKELRVLMSGVDFWDDQTLAIKISQEAEELFSEIKSYEELEKGIKDLKEILTFLDDNQDEQLLKELDLKYQNLKLKISTLEFQSLFKNKHDKSNAFISIHAGTGGVDAQDWAEMLKRMFLRFCEKKGFKVDILDLNYANEAGIKSAEIKVRGPHAYGYLKSENGVHRLLRNSPFNADNLRQTSFALVEIIPEIEMKNNLEIKDEDLRIDVYRSSGPGGQSVNTTDSAVRITHLPSGIVVTCQSERSQHQNKENALSILKNKLTKLELEKKESAEKKIKGSNKAEWGRQIRSYFLYANRLVKDHRSNLELSNVDQVLDGDLDQLIEAYLKIEK